MQNYCIFLLVPDDIRELETNSRNLWRCNFFGVYTTLTQRGLNKRSSFVKQLKIELSQLSNLQFGEQIVSFGDNAEKFKTKSDKILYMSQQNNCFLGIQVFIEYILRFFLRPAIIFYAKYLYQQNDYGFKGENGDLGLGYSLIVFFIYALILA